MDSPDPAKPRPVRFTRRPDLLSLPYDGENPGDDDDEGKREECNQVPIQLGTCQGDGKHERRPEEESLRYGVPTTRVLSKLGVMAWEVRIYKNCDPDGDGEEHHRPPQIMLLAEHSVETMGAPKGSDRVACEVDVDGRAYDGDEDDGVISGQLSSDEGYSTGEQEGVCNEHLSPIGLFDTLWQIEDEDYWQPEVSLPPCTRYLEKPMAY
jgi:hypothetical protein